MGAYDIGPRISITGEAEFRKSIRNINSEYKTLRTEMQAVQSQFEGQEKSEKSLAEQKRILSKQIDLQKDKIKQETAELEKYQKSTDVSSEKVNKFKQVINTSEVELGKLQTRLKSVDSEIETSNSRWGQFQSQMEKSSEKLESFGKKAESIGGTLTKGITVPVVAAATAAVKSLGDVTEGANNVIEKTGAMGDKAESLKDSYKVVASTVSGSFSDIGNVVGEVNTRFDFTGEQLENASEKFMEFSKVTGTDAAEAVRLVSRAMGDANMDSKDYAKMLDMLTAASQKSGISIETLTENITKYGAPMRELGYSTQQSVAMFSEWEKAGVTTEKAFAGMRVAINGWLKEGKDAGTEFEKTVKGIQDGTIDTSDAMETFGSKGGADMIDAIKQGRFNFEEFNQTLSDTNGTLDNTYNSTLTASDKAKIELNKLKISFSEVGEKIVNTFGPALMNAADGLKDLIDKFDALPESTQNTIIKFLAVTAAAGPMISTVGRASTTIGKFAGLFKEGGALAGIGPFAAKLTGVGTASTTASTGVAALGSSISATAGVTIPGAIAVFGAWEATVGTANRVYKDLIDANKQVAEETDKVLDANQKQIDQSGQKIKASQDDATNAQAYADVLFSLIDKQDKTAAGKEQIKAAVDKLNEVMPQLNLQYDAENDKLNQSKDTIYKKIEAMKQEAIQSALTEQIKENAKKEIDTQKQLADVNTRLADTEKKLAETKDACNRGDVTALRTRFRLTQESKDLKDQQTNLKNSYSDLTEQSKKYSLQASLDSDQQTRFNNAINSGSGFAQAYSVALGGAAGSSTLTASQIAYLNQQVQAGVDPSTAYANAVKGVGNASQQAASESAGTAQTVADNSTVSNAQGDQVQSAAKTNIQDRFKPAYSGAEQDAAGGGDGVAQALIQGMINSTAWGSMVTLTKKFQDWWNNDVKWGVFGSKSPSRQSEQLAVDIFKGMVIGFDGSDFAGAGTVAIRTLMTGMQQQAASAKPISVATQSAGATNAVATSEKGGASTQSAAVQTGNTYAAGVSGQTEKAKASGSTIAKAVALGTAIATPTIQKAGTETAKQYTQKIEASKETAKQSGETTATAVNTGMNNLFQRIGLTGAEEGDHYAQSLKSTFPIAKLAGTTVGSAGNTGIAAWLPTFKTTGVQSGQNFANGVSSQQPTASSAGNMVAKASDEGMIQGVTDWQAGGKITEAAQKIIKDVRKAFGINSPSTEFYQIGYWCIMGLINGFTGNDIGGIAEWIKQAIIGQFGHGLDLSTLLATLGPDGYALLRSWGLFPAAGNGLGGAMGIFENLLDDDTHGYSQSNRWGPDYDCSSSIIWSLQQAGIDTGNASYTGNMSDEFTARGWERLGVPAGAPDGLEPGDILLNDSEHVGWWLGDALGAFHSDYDGKPGDGNGQEASRTGYYDHPWSAILRYVAQSSGGDLDSWIATALSVLGMDQSNAAALRAMAMGESGGNPQAINNWDSNAAAGTPSKGVMQVIDPTFDAYKLAGYDDIWDPVANIIASIRYQLARYGGIVGHPGYSIGSRYIPYDMEATVHEGEMIIPKNENPYANSGGSVTGGLMNGEVVQAINNLGDRLSKMEQSITVNQTFTNANPTPSEISRKTKNTLRELSTRSI